jgi:hypothetical protein
MHRIAPGRAETRPGGPRRSAASLALVAVVALGALLAPDGSGSPIRAAIAAQDVPVAPTEAPDAGGPAVVEVPPPPSLGDVVAEDSLADGGPFRAYFCPTGRNYVRPLPDALRLSVTGRCVAELPLAAVGMDSIGVAFADGEVQLDVFGEGAAERAAVFISVRTQASGDAYEAAWAPSRGAAWLRRVADPRRRFLAAQTDLPKLSVAEGATFGVRAHGRSLWLLVNGEAVLSATDEALDAGGIGVGLLRDGDPDDDAETAVMWRNLRLTALAGGDPARAPGYAPPPRRPAAVAPTPAPRPAPPFVPVEGTPPQPGATVVRDALTESAILSRPCPTGRGATGTMHEGLQMWVSGPCTENARRASVFALLHSHIAVPDGEIRFDFKLTDGHERALLTVEARTRLSPYGTYRFYVAPALGVAGIGRADEGRVVVLSERADLGSDVARDGWNTLAIRLRGPELWMLLNDRPVLKAEDRTFGEGYTIAMLERLGPLEDGQEVGVILRDFRISALQGSPSNRRPDHEQLRR